MKTLVRVNIQSNKEFNEIEKEREREREKKIDGKKQNILKREREKKEGTKPQV